MNATPEQVPSFFATVATPVPNPPEVWPTADHAPLTLTISGELARSLRTTAREGGWSLDDLLRHVVSDLAETASHGLFGLDDADEFGLNTPELSGTWVAVVADDSRQQAWEAIVRSELGRLGADLAEAEEQAEGFGQDFAEWAHDPRGYAAEIVREMNDDSCPCGCCGPDDDCSCDDECCDCNAETEARCVVCGDPASFCQGHGEIGDPVGFAVLQRHDAGDHGGCVTDCE